jgi:hypothetical protein
MKLGRNKMIKKKKTHSILKKEDWYDYLILLYFGDDNPLSGCINKAYRDFNRTLHGLGKHKNNEILFEEGKSYLKSRIRALKKISDVIDQSKFDRWHHTTCKGLIRTYKKYKYSFFTIGQAQKWINMTLKYIFTMSTKRLSGFEEIYPFCHAPVDNIILEELIEYDAPGISCRWSRLNDYEEYIRLQKWIRNNFDTVPLDTEFKMWKGEQLNLMRY